MRRFLGPGDLRCPCRGRPRRSHLEPRPVDDELRRFLRGDRVLTEPAVNESHPVRLGQSLDQVKRPLHGLDPGREPESGSAPGDRRDDLDGQKGRIRIEVEVENAPRRGVRQQRGQTEAPADLAFQVRRLEPGIERQQEDLLVQPDVDGPIAHTIASRAHLVFDAIVGKHSRVLCSGTPLESQFTANRPAALRHDEDGFAISQESTVIMTSDSMSRNPAARSYRGRPRSWGRT